MNLNSLTSYSKEELDRTLHELRENGSTASELQQIVQELQVHQIELEMHNRALRETQTELEHSVQRYSDLYDNLPLAYVTTNASGMITAANRAAHEWLQSDKRGLVGRYVGSFFDSYDAGRLAAHLENALRSEMVSSLELTMRPPGTEPRTVQISTRPVARTLQHAAEVHLAITDVSKLKQSQKMLQEINREQEAFNYSISHDLRAPLVTITNYSGIVLSDYGERLGEDGRSMVERVRAAAARMEMTLKHLLEYSTLAREDVVLNSVDTDELVRELLIEHRGFLQEKHANVSVDHPLPRVRGCASILNQVLANLLTNAVKYAREGEPAQVRIHAETLINAVVLKVTDRGIGIESKYHEKIFRIFERLHGYSKYPGSGLGLAIARRAVERMRGQIWVESELGKGSCFCVKLPKG